MTDDDILNKAEALLQRHRASRTAQRADSAADFPVLTEIVDEPPLILNLSPPPAPAPAPAPTEAELAQLEQDLRLQLLALVGPEFERLVEAKVHQRLGTKIDEVMTLTRTVLEAEVRAVVREALAEVIARETERLNAAKAQSGDQSDLAAPL